MPEIDQSFEREHAPAESSANILADSVITRPDMQLAGAPKTEDKSQSADDGLNDLELVEPGESQLPEFLERKESDDSVGSEPESSAERYQPPYYHLRYDFVEDPLQKGIGTLLYNFDSIAEKMSSVLNEPGIAEKETLPMAGLSKILSNPELAKGFTDSELNSMALLHSQAFRIRPDYEKFVSNPGSDGTETKSPYEGISYTKSTLMEAGEILGVIKDA